MLQDPNEKLPVEVSVEEEAVSSRSVWKDDVWLLDEPNPAVSPSRRTIDWRFLVLDGIPFTDTRFAALLKTCKALLAILLRGSIEVRPMKAGSMMPIFQYLKRFIRWMLERNILRFSDLTREQILQYRVFVAERTKPKSPKPVTGKTDGVTMGEQAALLPLRHLIRHASDLDDAPRFDWRESDELLLATATVYRGDGVKPIPTSIAGPFYETALKWVREYAPKIIELRHATIAVHQRESDRSPSYRNKVARAEFEQLAGDHIIQTSRGRLFLADISLASFNMMVVYLETACYVVIAALTGMRVSELIGLQLDCLKTKTTSNDRNMLLLCSRLIKMRKSSEGDHLEWVAGWDSPDNPVRQAVSVLSQLGIEQRSAVGLKTLIVSGAFSLPKFGDDGHASPHALPMSHAQINTRINAFADFVGLTEPWHFTTHQFRMTFARYVATKDWTGLHALQRHFKHVSLQMTNVYAGNDHELHDLIADYRDDFIKDMLQKILGSEALGGKLGQEIVKTNQLFRGEAGTMLCSDIAGAISDNSDLILLPHEYGFCVYRDATALCGGKITAIGLETCIKCPNFIVTPEHKPYWEERVASFLQLQTDPVFSRASDEQKSAVSSERALAEKVLAEIA